MAKTAYKSGKLMVARTEGMYVIELGLCVINVLAACMTNKIKAVLVELIGDLPDNGEGYLYGEGNEPQVHLEAYDNLFDEFESISDEAGCDVTCLLISHGGNTYNVMQKSVNPKSKHLINSGWFTLIDTKQVAKEEGEFAPGRPMYGDGCFLFGNNHMVLKVPAAGLNYKSDKVVLSIEDDLTPARDQAL